MKNDPFTPAEKAEIQQAAPYAASDSTGGAFWEEVSLALGQTTPKVEPRPIRESR